MHPVFLSSSASSCCNEERLSSYFMHRTSERASNRGKIDREEEGKTRYEKKEEKSSTLQLLREKMQREAMRYVWVRATNPHQIDSHVCRTLQSTRSLNEHICKVLPGKGVLRKTRGIQSCECCHEPRSPYHTRRHTCEAALSAPAMHDLARTTGDTVIFDRNPACVCIGEGAA